MEEKERVLQRMMLKKEEKERVYREQDQRI